MNISAFKVNLCVHQYYHPESDWIQDWIPDYLQPDTQVALRVEMEKRKSQADVPGYIYTFEIRGKLPTHPTTAPRQLADTQIQEPHRKSISKWAAQLI
jgi:hypothetical protein